MSSSRAIPKPAGSIPFFRVSQALQTQPKAAPQNLQTPPGSAQPKTPPKPPSRSQNLQSTELAQTQPKLPSTPSAPPPKASNARGKEKFFDLEGQSECEAFEPVGNKIEIDRTAFNGCLGIVSLHFHKVLCTWRCARKCGALVSFEVHMSAYFCLYVLYTMPLCVYSFCPIGAPLARQKKWKNITAIQRPGEIITLSFRGRTSMCLRGFQRW